MSDSDDDDDDDEAAPSYSVRFRSMRQTKTGRVGHQTRDVLEVDDDVEPELRIVTEDSDSDFVIDDDAPIASFHEGNVEISELLEEMRTMAIESETEKGGTAAQSETEKPTRVRHVSFHIVPPLRLLRNQKKLLHDWLQYRPYYLDELIRHDGRGLYKDSKRCQTCAKEAVLHRCLDCINGQPQCQSCILNSHAKSPLHRLEVSLLI